MKKIISKTLASSRRLVYRSLAIYDQYFGNENKVVIFCFHSISNDSWKYSVSKTTFIKQIDYLVESGYKPVSLTNVFGLLDGRVILPEKSFVICFDDGYQNILNVREYLNKKNIKPVVFVLADTKNADKAQLRSKYAFLNKSDLFVLMKDGWEIGCHSATHADFFKLTNRSVKSEIISSKMMLEKSLGKTVNYFAYPKGRYNKKIIDAVKSAGYKLAFSMDDGLITKETNFLAVPRVGVDSSHSLEEFKSIFTPSALVFRKLFKSTNIWKLI